MLETKTSPPTEAAFIKLMGGLAAGRTKPEEMDTLMRFLIHQPAGAPLRATLEHIRTRYQAPGDALEKYSALLPQLREVQNIVIKDALRKFLMDQPSPKISAALEKLKVALYRASGQKFSSPEAITDAALVSHLRRALHKTFKPERDYWNTQKKPGSFEESVGKIS